MNREKINFDWHPAVALSLRNLQEKENRKK